MLKVKETRKNMVKSTILNIEKAALTQKEKM
jgi:hypothetical protein